MLLARFLNKLFKEDGFVLVDADQKSYLIGIVQNEKPIKMKLLKKDLHWKLLVWPDYFFGLAYMEGQIEFENGTIDDFLKISLKNIGRGNINILAKSINKLRNSWNWLTKYTTIKTARKNAKYHYDVGDFLYDTYLDKKHRQYSCAYFVEGKNMSLEDAQESMLKHCLKKLNIKKDSSVLDIGCGWGGAAIYFAKQTGCRVTGITLSDNQLAAAKEKARKERVDNLCEFKLEDYRETENKYDYVFSKGMLEHVSKRYYESYFKKIYDILKPGGTALVHTIGSINPPKEQQPWISKFIFPDGYCPSSSELMLPIEKSNLVLGDLEFLPGFHYSNTLRNWKERFLFKKDEIIKMYDETFFRMWHFYLSSCENAFKYGELCNFQLILAKDLNTLPNNRNYIYS